MDTTYIVKISRACMPHRCWGTYFRVAVLEVVRGTVPRMISERARGVRRVVCTWERCSGRSGGPRTAYARARAAAEEMAAALNAAVAK